jgi:hypothetical protein
VERHFSLPCQEDEAFLMGVHSGLETTGTVHEEWNYEPFFPRLDKICIFINNGLGAHPVGEAIISLPSGYGRQWSSAHNCSHFSSQRRAEYYLELYPSDPSGLDADHDGSACGANKCPCGAEPIPLSPHLRRSRPWVVPPPPAPPAPSAECVLAREKRSFWKRQVSKDNREIRLSSRPGDRRRWTHRRNIAEAALKGASSCGSRPRYCRVFLTIPAATFTSAVGCARTHPLEALGEPLTRNSIPFEMISGSGSLPTHTP